MKIQGYQYSSFLKDEINGFIEYKRASGDYLKNHQTVLVSLDMFLLDCGANALSMNLLTAWIESLQKRDCTKTSYKELINVFLKYLNAVGKSIPLFAIPKRVDVYIPHVFTDEEWQALIRCADQYMAYTHRFDSEYQSACFCVLIRLLFGCGLRLGEALLLEMEDIDWNNSLIIIRKAKNKKQRFVPMANSLKEILFTFIKKSDALFPNHVFVFQRMKGGEVAPFTQSWARKCFNRVLGFAGVEKYSTSESIRGICPHCLRHTFTTRSFQRHHRNGRSFEEAVPYISAYLGHSEITGTDKYLNSCYELYEDDLELISAYSKEHNIIPEVWDDDE